MFRSTVYSRPFSPATIMAFTPRSSYRNREVPSKAPLLEYCLGCVSCLRPLSRYTSLLVTRLNSRVPMEPVLPLASLEMPWPTASSGLQMQSTETLPFMG